MDMRLLSLVIAPVAACCNRTTNFAGIISQGLRIAPPEGQTDRRTNNLQRRVADLHASLLLHSLTLSLLRALHFCPPLSSAALLRRLKLRPRVTCSARACTLPTFVNTTGSDAICCLLCYDCSLPNLPSLCAHCHFACRLLAVTGSFRVFADGKQVRELLLHEQQQQHRFPAALRGGTRKNERTHACAVHGEGRTLTQCAQTARNRRHSSKRPTMS